MFYVRVPKRKTSVAAKLERKDSVLRCGTAIPLLPGLAPSQVLTIRRSWKHINTKGLPEVIRRCFQKLERTNPKALSAFNSPPPSMVQTLTAAAQECHHPEIQRQPSASGPMSPTSICAGVRTTMDHTKYFLSLLDRIIETNQEVDLELKRVGAKHVILYEQYGLGIAEIEKMGEILAEAFFKLDGIRNSKETTKAWSLLFSKLIDHLRDGFETELRYQKRRTSFRSGGDTAESRFWKRNSMPSSRKTSSSKLLDISQITRKLSNF